MDEHKLREEFDTRRPLWDRFRVRLHALIEDLASAGGVSCRIQSRVKTWSSIVAKLAAKNSTDLSVIRDIVGIRVVVDSWKDVDWVAKKLQEKAAVEIDDMSHWSDDPRYQSIHFTFCISGKRAELPEWRNLRGLIAEVQIRTAFADAFVKATHDLLYKLPSSASAAEKINFAVNNTDNLSRKLAEFQDLLEKDGVHEKLDIHPFLKNNAFILHPNPDKVLSEVQIGVGKEYVLDFLVHEADGPYVLVEIENPRHALVNSNGDISAAVNHALQQVEDWQEWIEDNLPTVQKKFPDMSAPQGLVVIGRSVRMTNAQKRKIARRNINLRGNLKISTYDDLVANTTAYIQSVRKNLL